MENNLFYSRGNKPQNKNSTKFDFKKAKVGQQELENYIQTLLSPRITFSIHDLNFENNIKVEIIEIETSNVNVPVKFKDTEYIRVNSTKQKLKDFPEKERKLWKCFESKIFETQIIMSNVAKEDIFDLLDYDTYFNLMNIKHNLNKEYILEKLIEEDFVVYKRGIYNITITIDIIANVLLLVSIIRNGI